MAKNPKDQHPLDVTKDFQSLDGIQVLVVDDNADSLFLTTCILESYGSRVITATSALQALEAIKQFKFDIFIFDIAMPEMDGFSLISKVREITLSEKQQIPAIALTALGSEEGYSLALTSGFQSYVNKPVEPTLLVAEITKLINQSSAFNNGKQ
ncbi:response regulator [Komarekiella sp. 'clone 1']|uniref:Response regulator n=1 Tax=Komarekiella delphini-convector SJRDD-AB1 TaxID=2593771 RepID=A0AA40T108_9NOST|nr:response regulator [Komarekiella delphini-convector]MBD6618658.1 response regulator [Komarekiella delphini-convector SJRDD-AB1]